MGCKMIEAFNSIESRSEVDFILRKKVERDLRNFHHLLYTTLEFRNLAC